MRLVGPHAGEFLLVLVSTQGDRPILSPFDQSTEATKLGETLATGLPVVTNRGIGDLDRILSQERVGVFVQRFAPEAYVAAAERLVELMQDPHLGRRCRQLAEQRFSLQAGADAYADLYREIVSPRV